MNRSAEELAQTVRLEEDYELSRSPVLQYITNQVCGCGYVGSSYATRVEADFVIKQLGLNSQTALLDLGAGAGWPGLYIAKQSGCNVTLLDLPETGLRIARERSLADCTSKRVRTVQGDASELPFASGSFEAITHSDVLCCLIPKQRVLEECRRVIQESGRMLFSVIEVVRGLSEDRHARALISGPEFVGSDQPYDEMLRNTGWQIVTRIDRTPELERAYVGLIRAESDHETDLRRLKGDRDYEEGQQIWKRKLAGVRDGLIQRNLYLAQPE